MYIGNMYVTEKMIKEELFGKATLGPVSGSPEAIVPETKFVQHVRLEVAKILHLKDAERLLFKSMVGISTNGVDGIIKYEVGDVETINVTINLTTKLANLDSRVDIPFSVPRDGLSDYAIDPHDQADKEQFDYHVKKLADKIVEIIRPKLANYPFRYAAN